MRYDGFHVSRRRCKWTSSLILSVFCGLFSARGEQFTVTTISESGPGSLRQAMQSADQTGGEDVIVFDLPGEGPHVIELTSELPGVFGTVSILNDRSGDEDVTIRRSTAPGTPVFSILTIYSKATVAGLTIANGKDEYDQQGGGIQLSSIGTIRRCIFEGNSADVGGAIHTYQDLTLDRCTFIANTAAGAGGAVASIGGTTVISSCSFINNSLPNGTLGGAVYSRGILVVTNSTFSGNSVSNGLGGAVFINGALNLRNSTFSGNSSADGGDNICVSRGSLEVGNTVFRHSTTTGLNIYPYESTIVSRGHNLSDDAAGGDGGTERGGLLNGSGDRRNTDLSST